MPRTRKSRRETPRWPSPREADVLDRTGATVVGVAGSSGKSLTLAFLSALLGASGNRTAVNLQTAMARPDRLGERHCVLLELPATLPIASTCALDLLLAASLSGDELPEDVTLGDASAALASAMAAARRAVIINADDARLLALASATRTPVLTAGLSGRHTDARLIDGHLLIGSNGTETRVLSPAATPFTHPVLLTDLMVAVTAAAALDVGADQLRTAVCSCPQPPGRIETIGSARGARWVDDSHGDRPGRTAAVLGGESGPVVLIAGGGFTSHGLSRWAHAVSRAAAHALLFGPGSTALAEALHAVGYGGDIVRCADLEDAVSIVPRLAERGDAIIYSPGLNGSTAAGREFRDLAPMASSRQAAA